MPMRIKVIRGKPNGHCLQFPNGEFMFGRVARNATCVPTATSSAGSALHGARQRRLRQDPTSAAATQHALVNGQAGGRRTRTTHGDEVQLGPGAAGKSSETGPRRLDRYCHHRQRRNPGTRRFSHKHMPSSAACRSVRHRRRGIAMVRSKTSGRKYGPLPRAATPSSSRSAPGQRSSVFSELASGALVQASTRKRKPNQSSPFCRSPASSMVPRR